MARGRKADKGTYEAREKIVLITQAIKTCASLSQDAQDRVIKALYFGLGIKEQTINKINNVFQKVIAQKEIDTPIKEKETTKKESLDTTEEQFLSDVKAGKVFKGKIIE